MTAAQANEIITPFIRLCLVIGAASTLIYMLRQISRSRMQIEHSVFWALFSGVLFVLALFPQISLWIAKALGFQAPINLLYLIVIFILIVKLFDTTMKLSRIDQQLTRMAQHIALYEEKQDREKSKK